MDDLEAVGALVVIVVGVIIVILLPFIRLSSTGVGEHVGYVTAIEQKGYFFRNYQVYFKTDNQSSQEDEYCVNRNNTNLIDKLKKANIARGLVTITYEGVRGFGIDLCMTEEIRNVK